MLSPKMYIHNAANHPHHSLNDWSHYGYSHPRPTVVHLLPPAPKRTRERLSVLLLLHRLHRPAVRRRDPGRRIWVKATILLEATRFPDRSLLRHPRDRRRVGTETLGLQSLAKSNSLESERLRTGAPPFFCPYGLCFAAFLLS